MLFILTFCPTFASEQTVGSRNLCIRNVFANNLAIFNNPLYYIELYKKRNKDYDKLKTTTRTTERVEIITNLRAIKLDDTDFEPAAGLDEI